MRAICVERNIARVLLTKLISPRWPGFVWTPLSSARVMEFPDPPLPGPRWLRLRNEICGICASDLSLLFVHADPSIAPAALPANIRFFLGHEVVSVVTEVGENVTRFEVGDRVLMDTHFSGASCETLEIDPPCRYCADGEPRFCVNKSAPGPRGIGGGFGDGYITHETAVYPCPPDLSRDQAVLTEPFSVALRGVMRFPPQDGDRVLVIGAGIIGLSTLMAVKALCPDCMVTVVARYPHQAKLVEKLGAEHILTGVEDYATIAGLTGGKFFTAPLNKGVIVGGFDMIYDCVANNRTLNDALRWVRAGGTVMMIGSYLAPMRKVDLTPVWYHHVNLVGTYGHGPSLWKGVRRHAYEWVFDFLRDGRFQAEGLVTHRFSFEEYKNAIATAMSKAKARAIKVVFEYA